MEENTRSEQNNWAGGVHVAAFILAVFTSWSAGIGGMVAAFIVWLMKKDESPFIRKHAAEAESKAFDELKKKGVTVTAVDREYFAKAVRPVWTAFTKQYPSVQPVMDAIEAVRK
mgnify:CR=1 FL=1